VIAVLNDIVSKRCRWGFWKCFHRLRGDATAASLFEAVIDGSPSTEVY
jgi:hypothetical protein